MTQVGGSISTIDAEETLMPVAFSVAHVDERLRG